jgi:hypothetical protein
MHKRQRSFTHLGRRTTTKPYLHSFRRNITSLLKKHDSSSASPHQLQVLKVRRKHPRDQNLVARRALEQRCDWQKNKQQRTRGSICGMDFAKVLLLFSTHCCCFVLFALLSGLRIEMMLVHEDSIRKNCLTSTNGAPLMSRRCPVIFLNHLLA